MFDLIKFSGYDLGLPSIRPNMTGIMSILDGCALHITRKAEFLNGK